ncbi:hypothetical protein RI543_002772 [Arxiozyma heterogenica]|uniref:RFX-type winged-helix domain-containing protein n=1 Tax=Arxiozyma heterogenica TaxID=278026 RepID=A0AAN8A786_9SACH|nr:hypothetical protein RI543_002772 [Kazachstania heterogenica]
MSTINPSGQTIKSVTKTSTNVSNNTTDKIDNKLDNKTDNEIEPTVPDNSFQFIEPIPIKVSTTTPINNYDQYKTSVQYSLANLSIFQNIPTETLRGCDDLTRMERSLNSNLLNEMKWALKKYLTYSNKAPYMISLKTLPHLVNYFKRFIINLVPIINNFTEKLHTSTNNLDADHLQMGITSLLILRNLSQDIESVQVLIKDSDLKQFLLFVLITYNKSENNKNNSSDQYMYHTNIKYFNEILHYSMDLIEAISTYIAPASKNDPLFENLVLILNKTKDRALIISILRSLSRLLVRSKEDEESAADNLDDNTLTLIVNNLLISLDAELVITSFDFLYQFCLPGNKRIQSLLNNKKRFKILQSVLPEYLTYNVKLPNYQQIDTTEVKLIKRLRPPPPKKPPTLPKDLFQELLKFDERKRSATWLRCCFEPVMTAEYTQIQLWKSYETTFSEPVRKQGGKIGPAVEFIKNVSNAFPDAAAMVIVDPTTETKRFVIKGIQPRHKALSIEEGYKLSKWTKTDVESKFIKESKAIEKPKQANLPKLSFHTQLSDVTKVTCTFLCLISNDSKGKGLELCQVIKPLVMHKLASVPALNTELAEYIDNTPQI